MNKLLEILPTKGEAVALWAGQSHEISATLKVSTGDTGDGYGRHHDDDDDDAIVDENRMK